MTDTKPYSPESAVANQTATPAAATPARPSTPKKKTAAGTGAKVELMRINSDKYLLTTKKTLNNVPVNVDNSDEKKLFDNDVVLLQKMADGREIMMVFRADKIVFIDPQAGDAVKPLRDYVVM